MAFVKFTVFESAGGHVLSQRIVPLRRLRAGYRHVRLRTTLNQTLDMASLFVHSKQRVERVSSQLNANANNSASNGNIAANAGHANMFGLETAKGGAGATISPRHKQFKTTIFSENDAAAERPGASGAANRSVPLQVSVTQETTVQQLIDQVQQFCIYLLHI